MTNRLSPHEIQTYTKRGYLYPCSLLNSDETDRFLNSYNLFKNALRSNDYHKRVAGVYAILGKISALIKNPVLLDVLEDVLGPNILFWDLTFFDKPPDNKSYVAWHQDGIYWGLGDTHLLTVWLALTPSTIGSGCMLMLPASHLSPMIAHAKASRAGNMLARNQEIEISIDDAAADAIELLPGQFSLHHIFTAHSSPPNVSDAPRIGIALRFLEPPSDSFHGSLRDVIIVRGTNEGSVLTPRKFSEFVASREPWRSILRGTAAVG